MITLKYFELSVEKFASAINVVFDGKQTKNHNEISSNKFVVDAYLLKVRNKTVATASMYMTNKGRVTVFVTGLDEEGEKKLEELLA